MARNNWSREELIVAFNLYLKLPFGKMHKGNPAVINLAKIIGRTPSSAAMRLTNFASMQIEQKSLLIKYKNDKLAFNNILILFDQS